jgi:hypothetical protein
MTGTLFCTKVTRQMLVTQLSPIWNWFFSHLHWFFFPINLHWFFFSYIFTLIFFSYKFTLFFVHVQFLLFFFLMYIYIFFFFHVHLHFFFSCTFTLIFCESLSMHWLWSTVFYGFILNILCQWFLKTLILQELVVHRG